MMGIGNVKTERRGRLRQAVGTRVRQTWCLNNRSTTRARYVALFVGRFGSDTSRPSSVAHPYREVTLTRYMSTPVHLVCPHR